MTPNHAIGLALLAGLAWGTGNVAQKTSLVHLDGFAASGLTALIGALVLLPLAMRESKAARPSAKVALPGLLVTAVLFTFASTVMQFSYGITSVTNAGFLVNSAAVLTPILGWACLSQRPSPTIWPACLATLVGIFLMGGGNWSGFSPGDLLALLSALGYAVWTLTVGLHVMHYRRPVLLTTVQLFVCGVLCTAISIGLHGLPAPATLAAALPEILFLGLVSKGLAYLLMAIAQQHVSAACASILVTTEALFGALIAVLVLGETLNLTRSVGALCIVFGVVIAARAPASLTGGQLAALPPQQ